MASTLTVIKKWRDGQRTHIVATAAFSGSYVTGGEVPTAPDLPPIGFLNAQKWESLNGYNYCLNRTNGKLKVLSGVTEASAAAYPAGVTGDSARVELVYEV